MGLSDASCFVVVRVDCTMPEFEVGSSMKLSFADKVAEKRKAKEAANAVPVKAKAAVWSIDDDMDDDEVELVDSDQLLGEEDLAKPDPASLRGGKQFLPFFLSGCVIPHNVSNNLALKPSQYLDITYDMYYDFSVRHDRQEEGLQGLHLRAGRGAQRGQGGHQEGPQVGVWQCKYYII